MCYERQPYIIMAFRWKENKKELLSRHKLGQPGYTWEGEMQAHKYQLAFLPKKTNTSI